MAVILVVDDDVEIQQLLGYVLRREGHDIVEAISGEDALKLVQRTTPDLVILDLMLPASTASPSASGCGSPVRSRS